MARSPARNTAALEDEAPGTEDLTLSEFLELTCGRTGPSAFASPEEKIRQWRRHRRAFEEERAPGTGRGTRPAGWWWERTGDDHGHLRLPEHPLEGLQAEARERGFPWNSESVALDRLGELTDEERAWLDNRARREVERLEGPGREPWQQ